MLAISDLHVAYGQSEVLHGLNVSVAPNEIIAIMGRNGMGKTTLMKSLMGIMPTKSGSVSMDGTELSALKSYERVAKGLAYVPHGRMIFSTMTVKENIETGLVASGETEVPGDIYELFPVLLEMKSRRGGNLSGGQQQQLAIARALATKPKVLLPDEPTEGIQPSIIREMGRTLKRIRADIDLSIVHFLSGPIGVKGAEPGDLLVVDLLDVGPMKESLWGFNGFFSKKNGGGFLTDHFPLAQKSIWDIHGLYTSSRHVPGVNFAGLIHPGLIGCLPDPKLLETWNVREAALIATNPTRVPGLANPPFAPTTHAGQAKGDVKAKIAAEGARTVPPREHGGNCDIKDLSRGSKVYFPVYVPGGGLSMGDLHFSQGDGEITFCGAIEMAGWVRMKVSLIKGGMAKYGIKIPIFKPSPMTPNYKDYLIFEGISVDEQGKQHYLDVHIAYRQACLNAIEYLKKFGYSGAQAYSILGTAPVQGHISGVVDVPNACATLWLPTEIFDFDINPNASGPVKHITGGVDLPLSLDLV